MQFQSQRGDSFETLKHNLSVNPNAVLFTKNA